VNYKAIVSSAMMALVITGCANNDKEGASENLGLNRTHQDNLDNPMNVSDTRQNVNDNNKKNQFFIYIFWYITFKFHILNVR